MRRVLLALLLTSCSGAIEAENDLFSPGPASDEMYTHGSKFTYLPESNSNEEQTSYSLSQIIYTPSQKHEGADPQVLNRDRPYAGFLALERQHTEYVSENVRDTWGVALGCVGECSLARRTQRYVHKLLGQAQPTWDDNYYLSKSEPGVILNVERAYLLAKTENFDIATYAGIKAGSLINSGAFGVDVRWGWNLPKFSSEAVTFKLPQNTPSLWSGYLFGKLEDRIVGYNYFLSGSLFSDDSHTVSNEWNVGQADIGFAVGYDRFRVTYRLSFFSSEWEERSRPVSFGGITLHWGRD